MPDFIHKYVPSPNGSPWTLLLLHGTGGDERDLISLGTELGSGAALLSPRGKTLENGMPRFFRRLAMGVFDLEDLKFRTEELADFITASAGRYGFDPGKVIALGYSNGANIAASLLLRHPTILAGAVLLRPMIPFVPEKQIALDRIPIWIGGGRRDPIVPPDQTAALATMLQNAGAHVDIHWSPNGHDLSQEELLEAGRWIGKIAVVRPAGN